MPAKYQMSGRSLKEIAGLQRQLNSRVQLGVRLLQSGSVPHRLTGTTVDPQIPDQRRCISQVVRVVPTADSCGATKFNHSITSSAIASTPAGMITPSALAVSLIVSSYLVGCCTGN